MEKSMKKTYLEGASDGPLNKQGTFLGPEDLEERKISKAKIKMQMEKHQD